MKLTNYFRDRNMALKWVKKERADDGYTVRTKGKQVIAIFRPMKVMWESEEYAERSKQMGVNQ